MRVVVQRVLSADVRVASDGWTSLESLPVKGRIGKGIMVLCGFVDDDTEQDLAWIAKKLLALRIFDDHNGVMNLSLTDVGGDILAISQFTLMALTAKGNRPSYIRAAKPEISKPLYDRFLEILEASFGHSVQCGCFGADMKVSLVNDGPVTIIIDSKNKDF